MSHWSHLTFSWIKYFRCKIIISSVVQYITKGKCSAYKYTCQPVGNILQGKLIVFMCIFSLSIYLCIALFIAVWVLPFGWAIQDFLIKKWQKGPFLKFKLEKEILPKLFEGWCVKLKGSSATENQLTDSFDSEIFNGPLVSPSIFCSTKLENNRLCFFFNRKNIKNYTVKSIFRIGDPLLLSLSICHKGRVFL